MVLFRDPDDRWAIQVGKLILAFGDIEHTVVSCLQKIPQPGMTKAAALELELKKRVRRLRGVLENRPEPACKELLSKADEVLSLVDARNLIAHNMLTFCFYVTGETAVGVLEITGARRPEKRISYDEMCHLVERVEHLAFYFSAASAKAFEVLPWVDYEP